MVPCGERYWASVWCYAMHGTELAYDAVCCTALGHSGTELACGGTELGHSGTELAYGSTEQGHSGTKLGHVGTELLDGVPPLCHHRNQAVSHETRERHPHRDRDRDR
eukprot:3869028-Rhodomonas_salina.1